MLLLQKTLIEEIREALKARNGFYHSLKQAIEVYRSLSEEQQLQYQLKILDYQKPRAPARTHNAPQSVEVAALMKYDPMDSNKDYKRGIIIYPKGGGLKPILYTHSSYLPLSYPIFHTNGEQGWHVNLMSENAQKRTNITIMEFASYILHFRDNCESPLQKDVVLCGGKLTQQYILDLFICLESNRLEYLRKNQYQLKAANYKGLADAVAANESREAGKYFILPSTYVGSPRWFNEQYQDAMARVTKYGKPDLFITFTCSSKWPEIIEALRTNQKTESASNRPDIISRIFDIKLRALLNDLRKEKIFGEIIALQAIVEWQKRNLPHAHILLILKHEDKPQLPQDYDRITCAELPNRVLHPELFDLVSTHMIHGPCGSLNPNCVCMKNGKCKANFPKSFNRETKQNQNSYPELRRRSSEDGGCSYILKKARTEFIIDNSWVVPYNPYLLLRYKAHINVEICNTVKAVKYLHKYIYKGISKAMVETTQQQPRRNAATTNNNNYNNTTMMENSNTPQQRTEEGIVIDEIATYVECRYIGPAEAANRLFSHTLHDSYPTVIRLRFHLPGEHTLHYEEGKEEEVLQQADQSSASMLLAYFEAVRKENLIPISEHERTYQGQILPEAKAMTFEEFPQYFSHSTTHGTHEWKRRVHKSRDKIQYTKANVVSRLYFVYPTQGEIFYLRMLLTHIKGAASFGDFKTHNGVSYTTFKDACIGLGLVGEDKEWDLCLQQAVAFETNIGKLRQLFAIILINNQPEDPLKLWLKYKNYLSDDYRYKRTQSYDHNDECEGIDFSEALHSISDIIKRLSNGLKDLSDFSLPEPEFNRLQNNFANSDSVFFDSSLFNPAENKEVADANLLLMNTQQKYVYETLMKQINLIVNNNAQGGVKFTHMFLDAPGGTGKTFVINTIIARLIEFKIPFVASAFSGIAATLLKTGRTTHSYFRLPISKSVETACNVGNRSGLGRFLANTKVIIIDEAPMMQKDQLEAIHYLCHQLDGTITDEMSRRNKPFANKLVILSGDFRQTLPVCPMQNRAGISERILKRSFLWEYFQVLNK